jgi:hypothetical protein
MLPRIPQLSLLKWTGITVDFEVDHITVFESNDYVIALSTYKGRFR